MHRQELLQTKKVANTTKFLYASVFRKLIFQPSSPKLDHKEIQLHAVDK